MRTSFSLQIRASLRGRPHRRRHDTLPPTVTCHLPNDAARRERRRPASAPGEEPVAPLSAPGATSWKTLRLFGVEVFSSRTDGPAQRPRAVFRRAAPRRSERSQPKAQGGGSPAVVTQDVRRRRAACRERPEGEAGRGGAAVETGSRFCPSRPGLEALSGQREKRRSVRAWGPQCHEVSRV